MSVLEAIFLGIVQGLTEFLPVSSSGHLAIAQHYLPNFHQPGVLFDVLLHLGTLLTIIIYFRREIFSIFTSLLPKPQGGLDPREEAARKAHRNLAFFIVVGSLPAAGVGLGFEQQLIKLFSSILLVGAMLMVTGTALFLAESIPQSAPGKRQIGTGNALIIGLAQAFAIIPGISRSGLTIAAALLRGIEGEAAVRFSFLLSIPAILGAVALSCKDLDQIPAGEIWAYVAGSLTAVIIGLASLWLLQKMVRLRRLRLFAYYCWVVGATVLLIALLS